MKTILCSNKTRFLVIILVLFGHLSGQAQVADYIANQVKDYIYGQVNSVLHSTDSYLGSWGTSIWESVVNSKAESDLKEKAEEFKNFKPETLELDDLQNRYSPYARNNSYRSIYEQNKKYIHNMVHAKTKDGVVLQSLGNGSVKKSIEDIDNADRNATSINNLQQVLNSATLDSIRLYGSFSNGIERDLLSDIQSDYRIAEFLNMHPSAVKVYCNSIKVPELRRDLGHLLYWTELADSHRSLLSKKNKLFNPKLFVFSREKGNINITYKGEIFGTIVGKTINCQSIELLNFQAKPNTQYVFQNTTYLTDALGRVVTVRQEIGKAYKGKCKAKSLIKNKEFLAVHGSEQALVPFCIGLLNYGAPNVLQNCFYYQKSANNKLSMKAIQKYYKTACKSPSPVTIETQLQYNNYGLIPSCIIITNNKEQLVNNSIVSFR